MEGLVHALDILMFAVACVLLMAGFPVAFTLAGVALVFALLGSMAGASITLGAIPSRIFTTMTNEVLIAVPLFVFMGVMLERSKVAEELLETMGKLFGSLRGGLGFSVSIVGALLAASTGIVGATVVTMGLLSLPTMLRNNYSPRLACGSIAAAGTLGQIIPPSIVLVILGDQISNGYQKAQLELQQQAWAAGDFSFVPGTVSVGDLFAGALIPGLGLVGMYIVWQIIVAIFSKSASPAMEIAEGEKPGAAQILHALVPPIALIIAVLGSILAGVATPTEAAAVGAVGAIFIAGLRLHDSDNDPVSAKVFFWFSIVLVGMIVLVIAIGVLGGLMELAQLATGGDYASAFVSFGFGTLIPYASLGFWLLTIAFVGLLVVKYLAAPDKGTVRVQSRLVLAGFLAIASALGTTALFDMRLGLSSYSASQIFAMVMSGLFCLITLIGFGFASWRAFKDTVLGAVAQATTQITCMVFVILIGAAFFSLVFRNLGGEELVAGLLADLPGGTIGAIIAVMVLMFFLGFFLDFLEIVFVVVPLVTPILLIMEMPDGSTMSPIWLGIMMAVNLQTSFLTPPFGFALFYLRGVAPSSVKTSDIYIGIIPFVLIQVLALVILWYVPLLATWLPEIVYGN